MTFVCFSFFSYIHTHTCIYNKLFLLLPFILTHSTSSLFLTLFFSSFSRMYVYIYTLFLILYTCDKLYICTSANHKIEKSADPPLTYYFIYESRERERELKERNGLKMKVERKNKQKNEKED